MEAGVTVSPPKKKRTIVDLLLPTYAFLVKSPLKMTKNHNVAIGVGVFVGIGVQALILHPDGAQRVLSTPPKPFYVMLSI